MPRRTYHQEVGHVEGCQVCLKKIKWKREISALFKWNISTDPEGLGEVIVVEADTECALHSAPSQRKIMRSKKTKLAGNTGVKLMSCHFLVQKVSGGYISGWQLLEPETDLLLECMTIFPDVEKFQVFWFKSHNIVGQCEIVLQKKHKQNVELKCMALWNKKRRLSVIECFSSSLVILTLNHKSSLSLINVSVWSLLNIQSFSFQNSFFFKI